MKLLSVGCGATALVLSSVAGAAEEPAVVPSMTVVADRAELSAMQAVAPVVMIDYEEIARSQAPDVAALLRFVAGISVARNGGPGQPTSVFLRGSNSDQTLVLLNGVPIKSGTLGRPPLRNIDVSSIDRIEIVKGPRSSLYGSGAIGGVINIVTRRPEHDLHVDASVTAGHNRTREYDLTVSGMADQFEGALTINRSSTDGFPTLLASNFDRGHDNTSVTLSSTWRGDDASIGLRHWQSTGETEYLLTFGMIPVAQEYTNALTSATFEVTANQDWHSDLIVSHYNGELLELDSPDYRKTDRNTADWRNNFSLSEYNRLIVGLHFEHVEAQALTYGTAYNNAFDSRAVYFQNDTIVGPHHFVIAGRLTDDERFGSHTTGNVDYAYQITDDTRVTAGVGTAFHAPDAADRFGFGGNPKLDPEVSRSTEVGMRHTFGTNHWMTINAYESDIEDLIVYVDPDGFAGPTPGGLVNIAEARIRGLEIGYDISSVNWHWHAAATLTEPRNLTKDVYLSRRARKSFKTRLSYLLGPHVLGLQVLAVGPRDDSGFSNVTNAGYILLNLNSRFQLSESWTLYAKIANVFDTDYQLAAGYRTPGRGFYLTIEYAWNK